MIIQRNQVVEETILLEEIQRNHTKKQEVLKELEKDNRVVYIYQVQFTLGVKVCKMDSEMCGLVE